MPKHAKTIDADTYASLVARNAVDSAIITDTDGKILWVNDGFVKVTGYVLDEVAGKKPGAILQGRDTSKGTIAIVRDALAKRHPIRTEILNYTRDGAPYWIEMSIAPIFDETGRHTHFMAIQRDINDRRTVEAQNQAILDEEKRLQYERKLLTQSSEWLYSAKSMQELLDVVSRSIRTLMPEIVGQLYIYSNSRNTLDMALCWGDPPDNPHVAPDDCWALRRGRAYQFGRSLIEFPCPHAADEQSPYFCLPIVAHGDTIGLLHLSFPHISLAQAAAGNFDQFLDSRWRTAQVCAEQISLAIANVRLRMELHDQSVRDQLTGLWNRRWFLDAARRDMAQCRADGSPFGLISIDVDHFKRFNDHHGHDAGDAVLEAVGAHMARVFQDPMTPCRLGGEEFVVICPRMAGTACQDIAESFRTSIQRMSLRHGKTDLPPISVSCGVAVTDNAQPLGLLDQLKLADNALYAAKDGGRNQTVLHKSAQEPILWGDDVAAE